MSSDRTAIGPISSNYVIAMAKDSDYAFKEEEKPQLGKVPSQYVAESLATTVTLESNPVYQAPVQPLNRHHVLPGSGVPISGAQLKERVARLEDKVYTPALIERSLFFVTSDDDTKTAREEGSEPTFTLAQLKHFFGAEVAGKFTSAMGGGAPLEKDLKSALDVLSKRDIGLTTARSNSLHSMTGSQYSTSKSQLSVSRDALSSASQPSKGVVTAASRTMVTGQETSDPAITACSRTMLTASLKSDAARTACSRTMLTAADTLSCHTVWELPTTGVVTAASRTMLTASEMSYAAVTACSHTMLTGAEKSDSCYTGRAQSALSASLLTGVERSLSAHTANGGDLQSDIATAVSNSSEQLATAMEA